MKVKKLVTLSLLTSVALCLSFLESLIPSPFPFPGAKLGLTNIVSVYILYKMRFTDTLIVILLRVFLAGFLFGSMSSIIYALSGAILSLIVMQISKSFKINIILTSVLGGISHNMGQLILACFVTQTPTLFWAYSGILFIVGSMTGLFVGLCSRILINLKIDI